MNTDIQRTIAGFEQFGITDAEFLAKVRLLSLDFHALRNHKYGEAPLGAHLVNCFEVMMLAGMKNGRILALAFAHELIEMGYDYKLLIEQTDKEFANQVALLAKDRDETYMCNYINRIAAGCDRNPEIMFTKMVDLFCNMTRCIKDFKFDNPNSLMERYSQAYGYLAGKAHTRLKLPYSFNPEDMLRKFAVCLKNQ